MVFGIYKMIIVNFYFIKPNFKQRESQFFLLIIYVKKLVNSVKDKFEMVGSKIQEFSLPNSRGEETNIRDLQGKNVVVILLRDIN